MKKDKLIIIGAGGHGKVVADIAIKMNNWKKVYFLDDSPLIKTCLGLKVIGNISRAIEYRNNADLFVAIGKNSVRENLQRRLETQGISIATLIHPNAIIGMDVKIDVGTAIMAGVVINSSSKIGKGCIVNTSSSIDHDNIIGDYVHIAPGVNLAGMVRVGKKSFIGAGSIVSNNIEVSNNCKIGAGSVIIQNINKSGVYVGAPVRKIRD